MSYSRELGFVRIFAVFNDFVYPPLTPQGIWFLCNLSIILENTPGLRTLRDQYCYLRKNHRLARTGIGKFSRCGALPFERLNILKPTGGSPRPIQASVDFLLYLCEDVD
jgi:hypothetical protein